MFFGMRVSRVAKPQRLGRTGAANGLVMRALEMILDIMPLIARRATVLEGQHRVRTALSKPSAAWRLIPYAGAYRRWRFSTFSRSRTNARICRPGIRLSPRDPQTSTFLLMKGWAYMMLEQDEEGLVWFRRAAAALPPNPAIIAGLASELALTGRDTEARATLAQYLALESTRTRTIEQWAYVPDDNAAFMKFHWRFKSGLRKAGMPEQ